MTQALEALSYRQRERIGRPVLAYASDHSKYSRFDLRFDLIAIAALAMAASSLQRLATFLKPVYIKLTNIGRFLGLGISFQLVI